MKQAFQKMQTELELLLELLEQEHSCLVQMRYQDLLGVVAEKRELQSNLAGSISLLRKTDKAADPVPRKQIRYLAELVCKRSVQNEQLVRSSMRLVDDLVGFMSCRVDPDGQYDRRGLAHRSSGRATLHNTA